MKTAAWVFLAGVALSAGPALAAPTASVPGVANTSQKGSLIVFPQITVDPEESRPIGAERARMASGQGIGDRD
jgi:hypothetical protein